MNSKINTGTRLRTMLVDYIIVVIIMAMAIGAGANLGDVSEKLKTNTFSASFNVINYFVSFAVVFLLCKDSINGRSIAKRIFNLQVIDKSSGKAASPFQCLIRNITAIIWPFEIIVSYLNPARRIGDRIAGTQLIKFNNDVTNARPNYFKIIITISSLYAIIILSLFISYWFSK